MLKQLSIYAENKKGNLAKQAYMKAKDALEAQGYLCRLTNIIGVEMDDEVGNLNKLLQTLYSSNINVDYIYLSFNRDSGKPVLVFHADEVAEVEDCIKAKGYRTV